MMHQTHTRVYCMCHRRWILIVKGKYHLKFRTAASLAKCKQNYPVFKAWTNSLYFCLCLNNLKAELLLNCSLTPLNFLLLLLLVSKGRKLWEKFYVIFFLKYMSYFTRVLTLRVHLLHKIMQTSGP